MMILVQDPVLSCNRQNMILVMGNLKAKVGRNNTYREEVLGTFSVGNMNENGKRSVDFCSVNVISLTLFPHKEIHKLIWGSLDGRRVNQIDHVMVNGRIRISIFDTRVMKGADRCIK